MVTRTPPRSTCEPNAFFVGRQCRFLTVCEVTSAPNAENLTQLVSTALKDVGGLSNAQIGSKLVSIAADGASVMAGEQNGVLQVCPAVKFANAQHVNPHVLQRIKATYAPWALPMHCMAHRVNLAASGNLAKNGLIVKLQHVCEKVFAYFAHRYG